MDPIVVALATAVLVAVAVGVLRTRGLNDQLSRLRDELATERESLVAASQSSSEHMRLATEAETRLESANSLLVESRAEQARLTVALDDTKQEMAEADKAAALARQETEAMQTRVADREKTKKEMTTDNRSAMLSLLTEASNKLHEDHKRESKSAKEDGEKRVAEATKQLMSQFETLSKSVSSLNDQVTGNAKTVDVIERALSNPSGAGYAAETVLENTLKSFGLRPETDYVLQHTVGDGRLRPDALVFLPGNTVLVIDSKASKFILELAEAEDAAAEKAVNAKLAASMNQHLKDLTGKNYRDAVRSADYSSDANQLVSIMWLPNDAAVEKVLRADPEFQRKASDKSIYVVGPTGLWTAIGIAGLHINLGRQQENRDRIVESVRELIKRMSVMLEHAGKVGTGLMTATKAYEKFSGSINRNVLPQARKLFEQGIEEPAKGMPQQMPGFQVVKTETAEIIDAESDTVEAPKELPSPQAADIGDTL